MVVVQVNTADLDRDAMNMCNGVSRGLHKGGVHQSVLKDVGKGDRSELILSEVVRKCMEKLEIITLEMTLDTNDWWMRIHEALPLKKDPKNPTK